MPPSCNFPSLTLPLLLDFRDDVDPPSLLDVTNWDDREGLFLMPDQERLADRRLRIVVCTCLMAAKVSGLHMPDGGKGEWVVHFRRWWW